MANLQGKIAWITGAGGGIGEASAKALAEGGAHVYLSGRRAEELERVADEIKAAGGSAAPAPLDVSDADARKPLQMKSTRPMAASICSWPTQASTCPTARPPM